MKKFLSVLLKITIIIMAVFLGFTYGFALIGGIMNGPEGTGYVLGYFLEVAIALFLTYTVCVIVHEGGHLVFGLICGYRFCSFRIFSFMLIRQEGRMRFRRFKLAGTGGQCLMIPPKEKESRASILLYNLGGVIFNLIFALICYTLYKLLPDTYLLSVLLKFCTILSLFSMVTNGIPLNVGGIANDGMNALHLSKNPDAAEAFRKTLLINAAQTEGIRTSDMPEEWFTLPEGADMQNVHCASLKVFAASRPLDRGDTLTAEQQITELLNGKDNIIGLHRNLLTCDLICCKWLNGSAMELKKYMTPELDKIMKSMRAYPQIIRTQYFITLFDKKDEMGAETIRNSFDKLTRKFPYKQELDSERVFMDKALEKFKSEI